MSEAEAAKVERFTERVEEETSYEIWVDQDLGDDLGWFFVDTEIDFQAESFAAEVDFNLSTSEVSVLYAEITIDRSDEEREEILDEEADQIDGGEDHVLYEYYPDEEEVQDAVDEIRDIHSEIYG